jgi:hypothetical protein
MLSSRKLYKKVIAHVTTTMTNSIEEFSEAHWKEILDGAYSIIRKVARTVARRRRRC